MRDPEDTSAALVAARANNDTRSLSDVLDALTHVRVAKAPRKSPREYVGQRFGRLEVVCVQRKGARAVALCDCGAGVYVRLGNLVAGKTRSCGCLAKDVARARRRVPCGMRTRSMRALESAVRRCRVRPDYIAAGRTVDPIYIEDPTALVREIGECPPGFTLDRIDNSRGYEPGNLRWASKIQQARNRSTTHMVDLDGQRVPAIELCERHGIPAQCFYNRLARGWPVLQAATTPPRARSTAVSEAA